MSIRSFGEMEKERMAKNTKRANACPTFDKVTKSANVSWSTIWSLNNANPVPALVGVLEGGGSGGGDTADDLMVQTCIIGQYRAL